MEEICWKQFWETGKITDYLDYKSAVKNDSLICGGNPGSEDTIESDYSDGDGTCGISYR